MGAATTALPTTTSMVAAPATTLASTQSMVATPVMQPTLASTPSMVAYPQAQTQFPFYAQQTPTTVQTAYPQQTYPQQVYPQQQEVIETTVTTDATGRKTVTRKKKKGCC